MANGHSIHHQSFPVDREGLTVLNPILAQTFHQQIDETCADQQKCKDTTLLQVEHR